MKEYGKECITRLNRIDGQIKGIVKMIENGEECEKILVQLHACTCALKKTSNIILKNHLNTCVKESIERGEEDVMQAFTQIIEKFI
ncbi:MAG: metal-sensitive transcriptional regulator [Clostridia bacterium]|nr:metal-sensitive transcriptional regulator [Clostridia bacterium]MBR2481125.1 metal-sensitive transcriptional regulator [Clostridia bacterium]